jgi:hypothetical protein
MLSMKKGIFVCELESHNRITEGQQIFYSRGRRNGKEQNYKVKAARTSECTKHDVWMEKIPT